MTISLSSRIAKRTELKKPNQNAQNRAAFLAVRVDVNEAMNDGWPVKTIWETLHEEKKITFSYQAFRGYVNRLILAERPDKSNTDVKITSHDLAQSNQPVAEKKPVSTPSGMAGFTFNPVPNIEELI